jgi:hypothetical protein
MKKKIILKRVFHHEKWRIMISFRYDEGLVSLVRQIKGNAYSATYKSWYADDTEETLKQILLVFRDKADIDYIQELLGHRSTRTTEIYTHVSRRNLVIIRSPIEDMDVK